MAHKSVRPGDYIHGRLDEGKLITIGHAHCGICGACFIAGMTAERHSCPKPVDISVLKVFVADSERLPARAIEG